MFAPSRASNVDHADAAIPTSDTSSPKEPSAICEEASDGKPHVFNEQTNYVPVRKIITVSITS